MRRISRDGFLGCNVHAGERNVHLREIFLALRLVERAAQNGSRFRDRSETHRQSERVGDEGDFGSAAGRVVYPERVFRIFSRR